MALELSLSSREQNDNTTLILTDDAGTYDAGSNPIGWGSPNFAVTDIDESTHKLTLDIDITTSDNVTTSYDQINLYTEFNPFTDTGDLVFNITSALLLESGTAIGLATDELPDGLYDLIYIVDEGESAEDTFTKTILVYGKVKVLVYEKLRALPVQYNCDDCITRELQETRLCKTYLSAIENTAIDDTIIAAKSEELLSMLGTLNNIVTNGSRISW